MIRVIHVDLHFSRQFAGSVSSYLIIFYPEGCLLLCNHVPKGKVKPELNQTQAIYPLEDPKPKVCVTTTSALSLTPFRHGNLGLVICFYLKGYGLGALTMISPRKTVLSKNSFPLLRYKSHAVKAEKQKKRKKSGQVPLLWFCDARLLKKNDLSLVSLQVACSESIEAKKNGKIWSRSFTMIHLDETLLNKRGLFICVACRERNRSKKIQIITRIGKDNTRFTLTMNFSI